MMLNMDSRRLGGIIACGVLLGATGAVLWPMRHNGHSAVSELEMPTSASPIVFVADAQRQVAFHIVVPNVTPPRYRLIGARVFQLQPMETKAETEERLKRRVKFTGYGILLTVPPPGQPYTVRAAQGSPAEADGLASDQLQTLVAINGVVLKTRPDYPPLLPKNWSHELPPLKLTLVSDAGKAHTVTLKHTGEYYMGGEKLILPNDKRVALLFASAGSSFAIAERAGQPSGGTSTYLNGSWADSVNGTAATFYGSIRHPDADFSKGGIDYEITNDKGDLNQRQIKQIIRGL